MTDARTLLSRALDGFGNRLAAVPADAWDAPTPCDGWAVRDLVAHVVEEERWAGAVLAGAAPDDLAGEDVDEAPVRAWHHAASALRTAIAEPDVVDLTVRTSSGETSGAALLHELFADHLIHTWDLARAIGADERLDDDLVEACTAWFDAHEQQWRDRGEIGPPAPVRDDADAQTRLLARFGRAGGTGPKEAIPMTHVLTTTGNEIQLTEALDALARQMDGDLIRAHDVGYDDARALWNGLLDLSPAAIARCADLEDVRAAVRLAADHDLLVAVRGGGHNVAGSAGATGGLVIDLSSMDGVDVDPAARIAHVGGGATWADVDAATQSHGLATPGGLVSDTGVGGLTLGGGLGWLRRLHGLSCDNLVGATLVTADGGVREVDEETDSDVLWGLRGGGGNFGVATRLTFRLHPVGPDVFVAFVVYHADRTTALLRSYRDYTADLADEVSSMVLCGTVPEDDDLPQNRWGEPAVMFVACATADLEVGERLVQPLRDLGEPIADLSGSMPYAELQKLFDEDYPHGLRYYWKSLQLAELSDDVVALTEEWTARRPSSLSTVDLWHLDGALSRVPAAATAYGDRSASFLLGVEANWEDPADDDANMTWTRECVEAFRDVSTGREYLNFPGFLEDRDETLRAAHGSDNYARLAELKRRLDPANRFRLHQNVPPV